MYRPAVFSYSEASSSRSVSGCLHTLQWIKILGSSVLLGAGSRKHSVLWRSGVRLLSLCLKPLESNIVKERVVVSISLWY